jgi:hypothetical protein
LVAQGGEGRESARAAALMPAQPPALRLGANLFDLASESDEKSKRFACTGALPLAPRPTGRRAGLNPPSVML